jgi:hypothetical protein
MEFMNNNNIFTKQESSGSMSQRKGSKLNKVDSSNNIRNFDSTLMKAETLDHGVYHNYS